MNQDQHNQPAQPVQPVQPPQMAQQPAPDTNSFAEQPKVQYVVMQKSLEGVGGWLAFFTVIFGLAAVGGFMNTFKEPAGIHTVTDPIGAALFLACVILIAMRKKAALWVVYAAIAFSFLVAMINIFTGDTKQEPSTVVGVVIASLIFHGLMALYFFSSKRVKATLTK